MLENHDDDLADLAAAGGGLSRKEAASLEQRIRDHSEDAESRARLLGIYLVNQNGVNKAKRRRHVLWFIEHKPGDSITAYPYVWINRELDPAGYPTARRLWLKHLRGAPQPALLLGAARFFQWTDPPRSLRLIRRLVRREPNNPKWIHELARYYWRQALEARSGRKRGLASKALKYFEKEHSLKTDECSRWYGLSSLAETAFEAGELSKATAHAKAMLRFAPSFCENWNYGNAIHDGHTVLGRIALKKGEIHRATKHLREAGKTPGSPQLNSFGPSMKLARDLVVAGAKADVLAYLDDCATFWKRSDGALERWGSEIHQHGVSAFRKLDSGPSGKKHLTPAQKKSPRQKNQRPFHSAYRK